MYTFFFCIRRFLLVVAFLAFQDHQFWLIIAFNVLQSSYLLYMWHAFPHEGLIHNRLEYFNELCLICMQYIMVFFIQHSIISPEIQYEVGKLSIFLLILIFVVNLSSLVYLTIYKIRLWCRALKAKKLHRIAIKAQIEAAKKKQQDQPELEQNFDENSADQAKDMMEILQKQSKSDITNKIPLGKLLA